MTNNQSNIQGGSNAPNLGNGPRTQGPLPPNNVPPNVNVNTNNPHFAQGAVPPNMSRPMPNNMGQSNPAGMSKGGANIPPNGVPPTPPRNPRSPPPAPKNKNSAKYPDTSVPLSKDELTRLRKHENDKVTFNKELRKKRQPYATKLDDGPYMRMRRRLPANASRSIYFDRKGEITNLRSRYSGKDSDFGAGAARRRNVVTTTIIVLLILAILGVGTYLTYYYLIRDEAQQSQDITGDIVFVGEDTSVLAPFDNVVVNGDIHKNVSVQNATTGNMYVRFYIELSNEDGTAFLGDLGIGYTYDSSKWYLDTTQNYLYYLGTLAINEQVDIISAFRVTSENADNNEWAGESLGISFTVQFEQSLSVSPDSLVEKGWSQDWANNMA